jgi:hypothetical protein
MALSVNTADLTNFVQSFRNVVERVLGTLLEIAEGLLEGLFCGFREYCSKGWLDSLFRK